MGLPGAPGRRGEEEPRATTRGCHPPAPGRSRAFAHVLTRRARAGSTPHARHALGRSPEPSAALRSAPWRPRPAFSGAGAGSPDPSRVHACARARVHALTRATPATARKRPSDRPAAPGRTPGRRAPPVRTQTPTRPDGWASGRRGAQPGARPPRGAAARAAAAVRAWHRRMSARHARVQARMPSDPGFTGRGGDDERDEHRAARRRAARSRLKGQTCALRARVSRPRDEPGAGLIERVDDAPGRPAPVVTYLLTPGREGPFSRSTGPDPAFSAGVGSRE